MSDDTNERDVTKSFTYGDKDNSNKLPESSTGGGKPLTDQERQRIVNILNNGNPGKKDK